MIKLFVIDLDGCLSIPFQQPDWNAIHEIMELNRRSGEDPQFPRLTLCTGRPLPYTEAIAQWMGIKRPFVFEGGGGIYNPLTNQVDWADFFDDETQAALEDINQWIEREILPDYPEALPEFTKRTHIGLVHPEEEANRQMYEMVKEYVLPRYNQFELHYTEVSVNVVHKEANKARGVKELARHLDVKYDEMAYIGDGTNDIPAMETVGMAFAPANAREEVKSVAEVMSHEATLGVLEAYKRIVKLNQEVEVE